MQKTFTIGLLGCGNIGEAVALELLANKNPSLKLKKAFVNVIDKKKQEYNNDLIKKVELLTNSKKDNNQRLLSKN